jgi:hypothetical protein
VHGSALTAWLAPRRRSRTTDSGREARHGAARVPARPRTKALLERQRSGDEASVAHGLTPPAERRARKRYLEELRASDPDQFDAKDAGEVKK